MIREMDIKDREGIDRMQFELQKYFSEKISIPKN